MHSKGTYYNLRRLTAVIVIAFTALVGASVGVNLRQVRDHTRELAKMEALTTFNKDQAFRFWATNHGGVYVPPSETTPPNPYLSHIPDRDIELPSGKKLTLMNPAYIMKQAMAEYSELYGVKGHITSLNPLNPANKPDEWEAEALKSFENRAVKEKVEFTKIGGQPYLRLMQPMITQEGCLKCHAHQGYKVGDIRGGVSVSLPMTPYIAKETMLDRTIVSSHLIVWLLGMAGIGFAYRRGSVDIRERMKAREAIRAEEERFRNLVETTNDIIWEVDVKGVYSYISPQVRSILGYEPEELIGKTPFDVMPEDEAARVREFFGKVMGAAEPFSNLENKNLTKDGRLIVLESGAVPFYDESGAIRGYRGIDRDITERKKAEEELDKVLDELTRSNAELQQFAFVASHDLQEPLRAVTSYLRLLERRLTGRLEPEAEGFVESAVDGAARMEHMIKDLLEFSRVNTAGGAFERVDMNAVLDAALENLSTAINESGAVFERGQMPVVYADPAQFIRLLQNLIGNAIKFRKPGAKPVIEVGARESAEGWVFSVKDNGVGIAPGDVDKVFIIFQRVHGKKYPGTGLGLAICKRIVERHGGRIWVESAEGRGSSFHFTVPGKAVP
jgi:PAS domain S-box-containing protein